MTIKTPYEREAQLQRCKEVKAREYQRVFDDFTRILECKIEAEMCTASEYPIEIYLFRLSLNTRWGDSPYGPGENGYRYDDKMIKKVMAPYVAKGWAYYERNGYLYIYPHKSIFRSFIRWFTGL